MSRRQWAPLTTHYVLRRGDQWRALGTDPEGPWATIPPEWVGQRPWAEGLEHLFRRERLDADPVSTIKEARGSGENIKPGAMP